ncbi:hypothetical protein [Methylobacterium sp. SyP6R]|uniref:hypothetical protein n=1 Tax=Methylobacterium sp. SyP6R TaxID=2718876 RepID=UPI001F39546B|nr:hypothetical protein [Methylobacterium sp. SyP6R]MCF4128065.1 hypothetical protein [Methylobacterium sp. SyP6R]
MNILAMADPLVRKADPPEASLPAIGAAGQISRSHRKGEAGSESPSFRIPDSQPMIVRSTMNGFIVACKLHSS